MVALLGLGTRRASASRWCCCSRRCGRCWRTLQATIRERAACSALMTRKRASRCGSTRVVHKRAANKEPRRSGARTLLERKFDEDACAADTLTATILRQRQDCFLPTNPDKADWRWPPTRSYAVGIPSTAPEAPSGAVPDTTVVSAADDWAAPFDYDATKRAWDTSLDATANGRADVRDAYLGGQGCGNQESGGDSANPRKLAELRAIPPEPPRRMCEVRDATRTKVAPGRF